MFKGTWIILKFLHERCNSLEVLLNVTWYLRSSRCHNEIHIDENEALSYLRNHEDATSTTGDGQYVWYSGQISCGSLHELHFSELPEPRRLRPLQDQLTAANLVKKTEASQLPGSEKGKETEHSPAAKAGEKPEEAHVEKPKEGQAGQPSPVAGKKASKEAKKKTTLAPHRREPSAVAATWDDGPYVFILGIKSPSANWELQSEWSRPVRRSTADPLRGLLGTWGQSWG
nr:uncharacterized protein LOC110075788 [Pogona vitticeps]